MPTDTTVLWDAVGQKDFAKLNGRLFFGGPNSGPIVAVHQREDLAEYNPGEGVYFAAQVQNIKSLVADHDRPWKIYVGQAAWGPGDLDQQFSEGNWLPLEVDRRIIFEHVDRMWPIAIRQAGNRMVQSMVGLESAPDDLLSN
jgi:putative transcriptional regulator